MRWVKGANPWSATEAESLEVERHDPLPGVQTPVVAHQDVKLKIPEASVEVDEKRFKSQQWMLQFEGGASPKGKVGSGGVLVWHPDGHVVDTHALWFAGAKPWKSHGSNQLADWLTRVAKKVQHSVAVECNLPGDLNLFAGSVWDPKHSLEHVQVCETASWVDTAGGETCKV